MSDQPLRAAFEKLRTRVPESAADAAVLRAEVRAVDQELGELMRAKKAVVVDTAQSHT